MTAQTTSTRGFPVLLFEKLMDLLLALGVALGVALASAAGLSTAADHADPRANDAALTGSAALAQEMALIGFDRAGVAGTRVAALDAAAGLERALEALALAVENAPDEADQGLDRAIEAVENSPANDAGPPADVPPGPPADLPGGRP